MRTRVLWVVKGLGPGGAERLLAAAAANHDERFEFECAYVLPWKDHLAGDLEALGVKTTCLSSRSPDVLWPWRLFSLIRHGDFDVVHTHSPLPASVARLAVRAMASFDRPGLVTTEHNRWATHRRATRLLNRATSRLDAATIAVTEEVRASMRGTARGRAIALRHGIDVERVAADAEARPEIRAELGIGDEEFVVATAANFRPQKDYPNLLAAARELADRGAAVRFVAVGQGPDEQEIRRLHADLELGDRFILTGFRADATRVLGSADVFVMASRWEGLPVAVMEATALGLPIVATDVGGLAEEFDDGDDALLVPPGDHRSLAEAIEEVATNDGERARLASASSRHATQFDVAGAVTTIEGIYDAARPARPNDRGSRPHDASHPARPARPLGRTEVRRATASDRGEILRLLGRSLGAEVDSRYAELFAWKHDDNHFGASPTWVATEHGEIIAVRAFMRWRFRRGGDTLAAVRAVDTATDPDHQGKGLFRRLTMHALDELREEGVDFVFNTPNALSRPGYLKMGWRDVGRLPIAICPTSIAAVPALARSRVPAERWSVPIDVGLDVATWLRLGGPAGRTPRSRHVREITTDRSEGYLAWRFGLSLLGYRVIDVGDSAIVVRARMRGEAIELAVVERYGDDRATDRLAATTARQLGATYSIRLGAGGNRSGFVPLPRSGPMLTWRAVASAGCPPLSNWALTLGDIELF